MIIKFLTKNDNQTRKLGEIIGRELSSQKTFFEKPRNKALVLRLQGDLGGGKTTFLQGFARGLGVKEKILSPTFIIMRRHSIKASSFKNFFHLDCYRVYSSADVKSLRLKEILSELSNIVAVEWAERIEDILPRKSILLQFKFVSVNTREITIDFS